MDGNFVSFEHRTNKRIEQSLNRIDLEHLTGNGVNGIGYHFYDIVQII